MQDTSDFRNGVAEEYVSGSQRVVDPTPLFMSNGFPCKDFSGQLSQSALAQNAETILKNKGGPGTVHDDGLQLAKQSSTPLVMQENVRCLMQLNWLTVLCCVPHMFVVVFVFVICVIP